MKVNEKIRFLRETKNWSQEEMASKLGMSTNGYSKIERGETRLTIPKLEQIVKIFDTDILELISLGENKVIYIQDSDNHGINIINPSSQELVAEITQLKQQLSYQIELLKSKEEIISLQQAQLDTLQKLINQFETK